MNKKTALVPFGNLGEGQEMIASLHQQLPHIALDVLSPDVLTPALAIYPEIVDANIQTTLRLLGGDPGRWQPHVKTAKLLSTMRQFCSHGVKRFKCATTLEMMTACQAGAEEVLLSYPSYGARTRRVREIALQFPKTAITATVENESEVAQWNGSTVGLYIDINPGMNRTGIQQSRVEEIVHLASVICKSKNRFAGLHYYDGHNRQPDLEERKSAAYLGYQQLLKTMDALRAENLPVEVLVTSGTPAFPCAISFPGFSHASFAHRISPGTIVYGDLATQAQLPLEWGYKMAAVVIASVISHPAPGLITCDAGHKAVSSDAGVPNCLVLGHPELEPQRPSEEHLPMRVAEGARVPDIGEVLYLVPRHVCTTVNNFDEALLVRNGHIVEVAKVSARGRESALVLDSGEFMSINPASHR
jgi:D-serine deaminase-like pyridoxal phosphate-dependent protein